MRSLLNFVVVGALALVATQAVSKELSDNEIKKILIEQSHQQYFKIAQAKGNSGTCPCPDNVDRAGRRCGKRSAYLRAGGEKPLCYLTDVLQSEVEKFRNAHSGQTANLE